MLYYIEQDSNTFNQYNEVMSVALVTNEQVIKALRNYNPWWRNPSAAKEEDRPQHRVAYHETLRIIKKRRAEARLRISGSLVLSDIVFQITQTRFVVVNKRLRVFCIRKADNIAVLGLVCVFDLLFISIFS